MTEPIDARVAVYIDFDNIVISRYDQVHGRSQFMRDKSRGLWSSGAKAEGDDVERLRRATVDVGAIIDFASSFGTLVLTRAYADWSAPVNADYRGQLVARAVDLVQLFPAAAYAKNGADIRLAVDAIEDMFRLPDLTHVIIVAGDSDYIALAQRCKRLGRVVVGIGVAGSTSKSLAAACDDFASYDALPGVKPIPPASGSSADGPAPRSTTSRTRGRNSDAKAAAADREIAAAEAAQTVDADDATESAASETSNTEVVAAPTSRSRGGRRAASAPAQTTEQTTGQTAELTTGQPDASSGRTGANGTTGADDIASVEPAATTRTRASRARTVAPEPIVVDPIAPFHAAAISPVDDSSPAAESTRKRTSRRAQSTPALVEQITWLAPEIDREDDDTNDGGAEDPQEVATDLFERALWLGHEKDDSEWLHSSTVKTQMKRMDPSFSEKALGYRTFSDFVKSRSSIAEIDESSTARLIRLVLTTDD